MNWPLSKETGEGAEPHSAPRTELQAVALAPLLSGWACATAGKAADQAGSGPWTWRAAAHAQGDMAVKPGTGWALRGKVRVSQGRCQADVQAGRQGSPGPGSRLQPVSPTFQAQGRRSLPKVSEEPTPLPPRCMKFKAKATTFLRFSRELRDSSENLPWRRESRT